MNTPKSDAAIERFDAFCAEIRQRLESGKRVYGDSSFERPFERIITEIQQELQDVCGWSFIWHERLESLRLLLSQLPSPDTDQLETSCSAGQPRKPLSPA